MMNQIMIITLRIEETHCSKSMVHPY